MPQSDEPRGLVTAAPKCRWSYDGDNNPRNWGTLTRNEATLCFPLCADTGTSQQSPIDIETNAVAADPTLPTLGFSYSSTPVNVTVGHNNFIANYPPGGHNTLFYKGTIYNLASFHFHHPAEHKANGMAMGPIELHLVHAAATPPSTRLLVVAVFMGVLSESSADGEILAEVVNNVDGSIVVDATKLLPNSRPYFTYQGSLTTPPCTESVSWLLVDVGMPVHIGNVQKFKAALEAKYNHGYNARGVQRLNGRRVYSSAGVVIGGFAAAHRQS